MLSVLVLICVSKSLSSIITHKAVIFSVFAVAAGSGKLLGDQRGDGDGTVLLIYGL